MPGCTSTCPTICNKHNPPSAHTLHYSISIPKAEESGSSDFTKLLDEFKKALKEEKPKYVGKSIWPRDPNTPKYRGRQK